MNRRCRSSGDVARELVDRLPTPPRQGRYTVLVTSPLVSGVAAILWQGLGQKHEHGSAMQCNHTCRVYSSLFLYSSRLGTYSAVFRFTHSGSSICRWSSACEDLQVFGADRACSFLPYGSHAQEQKSHVVVWVISFVVIDRKSVV